MHPYAVEEFTEEEATILRRYFTNLESPVFALVNEEFASIVPR